MLPHLEQEWPGGPPGFIRPVPVGRVMDVTRAVHAELDTDLPARELLARHAINLRALARWMIKANRWQASEEAVLAAIRRYRHRRDPSLFEPARQGLQRIQVASCDKMASAVLRRDALVAGVLADFLRSIEARGLDRVAVVTSPRGHKVIGSEKDLEALLQAAGTQRVLEVKRGLTEVTLLAPQPAHGTPGILALVTSAVALRGVSIEEVVDGTRETRIYVNAHDGPTTFAALTALTAPPR